MSRSARTICVVTTGRADYGPLLPVLRGLAESRRIDLKLIAAAAHFSADQGMSGELIARDGLTIDARVEMLPADDTARAAASAAGDGIERFAEAFAALVPDAIVVLGDRYEIFCAVFAATLMRIPIIHLCGGDITEGAIDDAVRHGVTKMAHLHFVTNEESAKRVRQMGEAPDRVFNVGASSLDLLHGFDFLSPVEIGTRLDFPLRRRNILVTFHPVTLSGDDGMAELQALLNVLARFGADTAIVFTAPNMDPGGRAMRDAIADFCANRENAVLRDNLGQTLYFSLARVADVVAGNSSSGLSEVPSLGTPTIDIGGRQAGRLRGPSVIDCGADVSEIATAFERVFAGESFRFDNPYGDGTAARRIVEILEATDDFSALLRKRFHTADAA